jgi:hypothetical protein
VDGDGLVATDGGANGDFTLDVDLATTSGLELAGVSPNKDLQIADALAGDGLTITSKVLAVNTGTGLTISGNAVILAWSGTPGTILPDASAAGGSSSYAARTDHTHAIACAAPGANITVSTTNAEGTSTSFARADHGHAASTSSNPSGAIILAADSDGKLQLAGLGVGTAPGDAAVDILETSIGHLRFTRTSDTYYTDWKMGSDTLLVTDVHNEGADVYWRVYNESIDPQTSYRVHMGLNCNGDAQFDLDIAGNIRAKGWIVGKHAIQLSGALMICHYDGPEPFKTNYAGTTTGHMGQVATTSGGVCFRPGKFQKGVQIAEATTNYAQNPVFENNVTDGWSFYQAGSAGTRTQDTAKAYIGSASCKLTAGTGQVLLYFDLANVLDGESVTIQARVYRDSAFTCSMNLYDVTNSTSRDTASPSATGEWEYLTCSWTNDTGGTVTMRFRLLNDADDSSSEMWVDGCQLEKKAYATPLCHGDLGAIVNGAWVEDATSTHNWSGADHNSTSSRTAAALTYGISGNLNADEGTVGVWYYADAYNPNSSHFWSAGNVNGELDAYINSVGTLYFRVNAQSLSHHTTVTTGAWHHFVFTWHSANNTMEVYLDGVASTNSQTPTTTPPTLHASLYVGCSLNGATYLPNGFIDEFFVTDSEMDADEIRAIYESEAPVFAETGTFQFSAGPSQLVWADHEGMWARDADGGAAFGLFCGTGTKSWGGFTMGPADLVLGENVASSAAIHWDQSSGTFGFYGNANATVQVEIGTDGSLLAGAGDVRLNVDGIRIVPGTADKNILAWLDSNDDIPLDMWGTMIGGSGAGYVYAFADDSLSGKIANLNLRALAGAETHTPASPISGIRIYTYLDASTSSKIEFEVHDTTIATLTTTGLFINETVNAKQTCGITLNQGTSDDEIFTLKSSADIDHGATTLTENDTYLFMRKGSGTLGGAKIVGISESLYGLWETGLVTTDTTIKNTATTGAVMICGSKISSGTDGDMGTDANLVVIRNNATTRFIFDAEGEMHSDAIIGVGDDWDDWDDLALAADLSRLPKAKFNEMIKYRAEDFERAGLVTLSTDENGLQHAFMRHKAILQFTMCCLGEVHHKLQRYEKAFRILGINPSLV